jgi:hypothetical protein
VTRAFAKKAKAGDETKKVTKFERPKGLYQSSFEKLKRPTSRALKSRKYIN